MPSTRLIGLPKIKPSDNNGSIRIQFVINKVKYKCQPVYRGCYDNPVHLAEAEKIAAQIKCDIASGKFDYSDVTLSKYCGRSNLPDIPATSVSAKQNNPLNLTELWEKFEERQKGRVEETTFKKDYREVKNALNKLTDEQLKLDNVHLLVDALLKHYSPRTLEKLFAHLKACGNWAVLTKLLPDNPFATLHKQLPKRKKNSDKPECFTAEEMRIIIKAFRGDFVIEGIEKVFKGELKNTSPYVKELRSGKLAHTFYADFIEFLFLTGCRPEDAIALTWDDIKSGKIAFNKAYSNGVLKGTKTDTIRTFPVNRQLDELLRNRQEIVRANCGSKCQLVFPNVTGGYINLKNFTFREWKKVVERLVREGKIQKYLPLYNIRHTFISLMLRKGVDMQTVAQLCGTSVQMLQVHYWSPNQDAQIPEI